MREYWVASGHHLTRLTASGWMGVTDELLLAWLARPEVLPPEDACAAEMALHARLMEAPRAPVEAADITAMADPDARENWTFLMRLRDALVEEGTVEGAYLALVRSGEKLPVVFYDHLVQLVLRNALDGCEDVYTLRAAELFFRAQRGHVSDGALILADDELVGELKAGMHTAPLTMLLAGSAEETLDVLGEDNAWTYWSRSDAHAMALNFGGNRRAREGLAAAIKAFVRHLLRHDVEVIPLAGAEGVDLKWFVGLDQVGTAIGNSLWHAKDPDDTLVGLFRLDFTDATVMLQRVAGHPVYLLLGMGQDKTVRMKPQNLVMGLPLADAPHLH